MGVPEVAYWVGASVVSACFFSDPLCDSAHQAARRLLILLFALSLVRLALC
jgi:hypothetical protein